MTLIASCDVYFKSAGVPFWIQIRKRKSWVFIYHLLLMVLWFLVF